MIKEVEAVEQINCFWILMLAFIVDYALSFFLKKNTIYIFKNFNFIQFLLGNFRIFPNVRGISEFHLFFFLMEWKNILLKN